MALEWFGEELKERARHASRRGINSVMADCVATAKDLVPVDTAALQGSIQMRDAEVRGDEIVGLWGSWSIAYALAVETGTRPHTIYPSRKKALWWPGLPHPVAMVHHPGTPARPYLIPSAKRNYPKLPERIRAEFGV